MFHTKRHVDNGLASAALGSDVVHSPVETGQNTRVSSLGSLENLDGNNGGLWRLVQSSLHIDACTDLLSNTIGRASNSTSNVSAVSKGVSVSSREDAVSCNGATAELGVGDQNTTVDNIGIRALASRGVINVASRARGAVGDRSKTPGSSGLGSQGPIRQLARLLIVKLDNLVRLDEGDLFSM